MYHLWKTSLIIGLTCVLGACTTTGPSPQNQKTAAQPAATSVPPAQIPADLSSAQAQNTFTVPGATEQTPTTYPLPATPPGSNLQPATKPAASTPSSPNIAASEAAAINGRIGLSVQMPYQQAWTQVGKALPKAGYPIMEQDASSGVYYIVDKVGSGGVIQRDTPIYQLHLQKVGDTKTMGTLTNSQNQPASPAVSQRILGAVKRSL